MHAEHEPTESISVRLPKRTVALLDKLAKVEGVDRSDLLKANLPSEDDLARMVRKSEFPRPTVPKGEAHDRTENLVGKDLSQQSAMVKTTFDPSQPRPKTTISPGTAGKL